MWFFTADQHFDHAAIMGHCNRPFSTVQEMNEHIIEAWNNRVGKGDITVIAGDITLHTSHLYVQTHFLSKLNGTKIIVRGNHDWWDKDKRHIYHRTIYCQGIAICHYPMRTWKNHQHGWWQLHGHSHGTLAPLHNQLDVGVDVAYQFFNEYRPFSFDEVQYIMEERRDKCPTDSLMLA